MSTGVKIRATVPDPAVVGDLEPGARVSFEYTTRAFGTPTLVRLARSDDAPRVHDHTPRHGGVVAMVGTHHVEARADADGTLRIWLTDFYRRPLPLAGVRGIATLERDGTVRGAELAADGDALAGKTEPFDGARVTTRITLFLDEGPLVADLVLPIAADATGVASVTQTRCVPRPGGEGPRCTLAMSHAVSAIAVSPDGTTLVVAVAGGAVSVWRLPDGTLVGGVDPAPPVALPPGEEPRPEIVSRIAWRPDGRDLALVLEGRVLRYTLPSGQLLRTLSDPMLSVRDVAWWPDGSRVVVTAVHDPQAHALDVESGRDLAQFEIKLEGAAIAIEPGGETLLVGSEAGTITRFRARDGKVLDTFAAGNRAILSIVRAGDTLVALGKDGVVRTLDARDGTQRASVAVGTTPTRFASGPDGRVAVGLEGGRTTIVDPRAGTVVRTLQSGDERITAVEWHDHTVVTGDEAGRVAVWDVE
jgi:WD40 repeat protein